MVVIQRYYFERGLLNRICGFHLAIERNGYFVYFCFIVQTFCNKTRWNTNCLKNEHISCWRTFSFFLIGTENVKTLLSWMKPSKCVRQLMRNKWTDASECTKECSDGFWLFLKHWEAGGVSMHLTLMFQWCIAQSHSQTGHEIEL